MRSSVTLITLILALSVGVACTPKGPNVSSDGLDALLADSENGVPLVVLESQADFLWNSTPATRFPRFVLYGGGRVISLPENPESDSYTTVVLSRDECVSLLRDINFRELSSAEDASYVASNAFHAGSVILSLRRENGTYARYVTRGWPGAEYRSEPRPDFPPRSLYEAVQILDRFNDARAQEWGPAEYEVYSWPCGVGMKDTKDWPEAWPDLPQDRPSVYPQWNVSRLSAGDPDTVPTVLGPTITTMFRSVRRGSKEWCVNYRPIFPSEALWRADG